MISSGKQGEKWPKTGSGKKAAWDSGACVTWKAQDNRTVDLRRTGSFQSRGEFRVAAHFPGCRIHPVFFTQIAGLLLLIALFPHCGGEDQTTIRKKLDVICSADLTALVDSIPDKDLLEKPYCRVVLYDRYNEGKYSIKAVVEYFFLKKVAVKVVRKYRYHRPLGMWDRYSNEYVFIHDSTDVPPR